MKTIALFASLLSLAASVIAQSPACPTTLVTPNAPFNLGPTSTTYLSTATSTSSVDCGDCDDLVVTSRHFGPGPVAIFTTTVTVPETTATAYVCSDL